MDAAVPATRVRIARKALAGGQVTRDIWPVDNARSVDPAPPRLWSLDVLRGVCAGIVFLSHWHLWSGFAPRGSAQTAVRHAGELLHDSFSLLTWPTGGHHPAVLGFFVLSGFCIHYPFERRARAGDQPQWHDYFSRRFRRIMPVYWAACALGLLFVALETVRPSGNPLLHLHASGSAGDSAIRFLGLAGVYPREIFAGNYILTTVTVEIFMYAAYPVFYRAAAGGRWRELGLLFFAFHVLAIAMLRFFTPYWVFNSVFMLGVFWYAGAWSAHVFLEGRAKASGAWLVAAWAGFLVLKALPHFPGLNLLKQAAWACVCVLGILWAIAWEQGHSAWGERGVIRALRKLGTYSYSLYAVHTPAIMLATWALTRGGVQDYFVQLAATMAASVAATAFVHFGIERVFYRPSAANPVVRNVGRPAEVR